MLKNSDAEALLRRPALRLGPAFEILDIGKNSTVRGSKQEFSTASIDDIPTSRPKASGA